MLLFIIQITNFNLTKRDESQMKVYRRHYISYYIGSIHTIYNS